MDKACFLVVTFLLVKIVLGKSEVFYCHGDICNSGKDKQFCSTAFRLCRNCADIVGDCGTPAQPINCTSYCAEHLAVKKLTETRDAKCVLTPNVTSGHVSISKTKHVYDQGNILPFTCTPGHKLEYPDVAVCGPFGEFRYSAPTCKAITCKSPPNVPNGHVIDELDNIVYRAGHNVSYTCDSGYSLHGAKTLSCTMDGVWTASNNIVGPVCLQDTSNGWMYAFIILFVGVCVTVIFWGVTIAMSTRYLALFVNTFPMRRDYSSVNADHENDPDLETGQSTGQHIEQICRRELNKSGSFGTSLQLLTHSQTVTEKIHGNDGSVKHNNNDNKFKKNNDYKTEKNSEHDRQRGGARINFKGRLSD